MKSCAQSCRSDEGLSRDRSPGLWQEVVFRALPRRPQSPDALESSAHRPPLGGTSSSPFPTW